MDGCKATVSTENLCDNEELVPLTHFAAICRRDVDENGRLYSEGAAVVCIRTVFARHSPARSHVKNRQQALEPCKVPFAD